MEYIMKTQGIARTHRSDLFISDDLSGDIFPGSVYRMLDKYR